MNPGTTASVICPACGQAFLSMQQSMEGMAQCPHCAHNAPRGHFGTHAQVAGVMQVRRRVSQTQPLQSMTAPVFQPPSHVPSAPAQPAVWQAMPVQTPTASIARATLQHSQALMPTGAPTPAYSGEFSTPPHLRTSPWRGAFIMLAFMVICGAAVWMWWDHANAPAVIPPSAASSPPPVQVEMRKAQIAAARTETTRVVVQPPDVAAISADVKALTSEFFAADTPERRAACIHDAGKHSAEIEAQFGTVEKAELRLLARVPGMPLIMPGGQPAPLFKLVTSKCPNGALIRLETGADGKRRIYWPLLAETHASKLASYVNQQTAEAAWFHVGMRPSHGLDIPAELRAKYITFDVQVSANSDPHFVACVERDTPLGRFLDRETEWGKAYLARLLVRKLEVQADAPCLLVIDCEGAQEK